MRISSPDTPELVLGGIFCAGTFYRGISGLFNIGPAANVFGPITFVAGLVCCVVGLAVVCDVANAGMTRRRRRIRYRAPAQISLLLLFGPAIVCDVANVMTAWRRWHIRFHGPAQLLLLSPS
jgi:xanthine/uracil permease